MRGAPARGHVEHVAAAALLLAAGLHGLDRGEALVDVSRGEGEDSGEGQGEGYGEGYGQVTVTKPER